MNYFCTVKKSIAVLLLSIFFLVTAGPAVNAFFSDATTVLIMDEDKSPSGTEIKKETRACNYNDLQMVVLSDHIATAFLCSERLHPSPFLEIPLLPPNARC